MNRPTFTRSKDGVLRTTIRVEHRADVNLLATAGALSIDREFVDHDDWQIALDALLERAGRLTQREILNAARWLLYSEGMDGSEFANERTHLHSANIWDQVHEACVERCRQLWPELA